MLTEGTRSRSVCPANEFRRRTYNMIFGAITEL